MLQSMGLQRVRNNLVTEKQPPRTLFLLISSKLMIFSNHLYKVIFASSFHLCHITTGVTNIIFKVRGL